MERNIFNWNPSILCPFKLTSEPEKVFIIGFNADDRRHMLYYIFEDVHERKRISP